MIKRKQGTKHAAAAKKARLAIGQRLERGARDYARWSKKFEADPRLNQIYQEEAAKVELWSQLAGARQRAGLTQEQLAKRLGVTQSQVAKMEKRGYDSYTLNSLRRYVEALGGDFTLEVKVRQFEGKERVFSMVKTAQKRNANVPAAELERDVRESLKTLRQERRVRNPSPE